MIEEKGWVIFQKDVGYAKKHKTQYFTVKTKSSLEEIGHISWYGQWRKYVFFPDENTLYDSGCLKDIVDFLDALMSERRN